MTFVQSHEHRYWILAGEHWRASGHPGNDYERGYNYALLAALEDCAAFPKDDAIRLARERNVGMTPSADDRYYDGFVAGCQRAARIMQGGIA